MAAYRRVYDSHHLPADCQEPGSAPERTLGNRVWATFFYSSRAWNSLPDAIRRSPSLATFKRSLKTYFLSSVFINVVLL